MYDTFLDVFAGPVAVHASDLIEAGSPFMAAERAFMLDNRPAEGGKFFSGLDPVSGRPLSVPSTSVGDLVWVREFGSDDGFVPYLCSGDGWVLLSPVEVRAWEAMSTRAASHYRANRPCHPDVCAADFSFSTEDELRAMLAAHPADSIPPVGSTLDVIA